MAKKNNKRFESGINQLLSSAESSIEEQDLQPKEQQEVEVSLTFTLPQTLRTKLKMYAVQNDTSIKKVIIELLEKKLK